MNSSIIIRVKNEKQAIEKLLKKLTTQTDQDFEVIIVNDNSVDESNKIVFNYFSKNRAKLINVPKDKFTYSYALNLGAIKAKGNYLVFLSAHSLPITDIWLEEGLSNFSDNEIAGVFSYPIPHLDATIPEKFFYGSFANIINGKRKVFTSIKFGLLGNTNSIIRKDLWEKHHFNEELTLGGEDQEWANYWIKKGYKIIHDPKFRVYHSHYLGLIGLVKQ